MVGLESISSQKDTRVVGALTKHINNIFDTVRLTIEDVVASHSDGNMSYRDYDSYKVKLKNHLIDKELNSINKILSDRFGSNFIVEFTQSGINRLAYVIMPPLNYKVANMAINDLEDLFPKKRANAVLWETIATNSEKNTYNTLLNLKTSLEENKLEIDLENVVIKNLDASNFVINVDFLAATVINMTPEELVAVMLHEVGHVFTYLEYMFSTTNNTLTLVDTFLTERFANNKPPLKALIMGVEKTDVDVKIDKTNGLKTLESLDMFMLKTYRINKRQGSIRIDFERMADQFATRFQMGPELASALIKIKSLGSATMKHDESKPDYKDTDGFVLTAFTTVIKFIMFILSVLIFSVVGLIILTAYAVLKFAVIIFKFIATWVARLFKAIFISDINQKTTYDSLPKRIHYIKMDMIRQLRRTEADKFGKSLLTDNITKIKTLAKQASDTLTLAGGFGIGSDQFNDLDDLEKINFFIENQTENEIHYYKNKFENI